MHESMRVSSTDLRLVVNALMAQSRLLPCAISAALSPLSRATHGFVPQCCWPTLVARAGSAWSFAFVTSPCRTCSDLLNPTTSAGADGYVTKGNDIAWLRHSTRWPRAAPSTPELASAGLRIGGLNAPSCQTRKNGC